MILHTLKSSLSTLMTPTRNTLNIDIHDFHLNVYAPLSSRKRFIYIEKYIKQMFIPSSVDSSSPTQDSVKNEAVSERTKVNKCFNNSKPRGLKKK